MFGVSKKKYFGIENEKIISGPRKKKYILEPRNKKKYFGIKTKQKMFWKSHGSILAVLFLPSADPLFHQQEVSHANETKKCLESAKKNTLGLRKKKLFRAHEKKSTFWTQETKKNILESRRNKKCFGNRMARFLLYFFSHQLVHCFIRK